MRIHVYAAEHVPLACKQRYCHIMLDVQVMRHHSIGANQHVQSQLMLTPLTAQHGHGLKGNVRPHHEPAGGTEAG